MTFYGEVLGDRILVLIVFFPQVSCVRDWIGCNFYLFFHNGKELVPAIVTEVAVVLVFKEVL